MVAPAASINWARARRVSNAELAWEAEAAETELVSERERLRLVGWATAARRGGGRRGRRRRGRGRAAAAHADEREQCEQREQEAETQCGHRHHIHAAELNVGSDENATEDTRELNQSGVRTPATRGAAQTARARALGATEQLWDERHEEAETRAGEGTEKHENVVRVELLETRPERCIERGKSERVGTGSEVERHRETKCAEDKYEREQQEEYEDEWAAQQVQSLTEEESSETRLTEPPTASLLRHFDLEERSWAHASDQKGNPENGDHYGRIL